jgi:hypothetical protein
MSRNSRRTIPAQWGGGGVHHLAGTPHSADPNNNLEIILQFGAVYKTFRPTWYTGHTHVSVCSVLEISVKDLVERV